MSANPIPLREDTHGVIPYAGENLPLHEIEYVLSALTEVDVEALAPEVRAQFEGILIEAVRTSVEKRERVAWRLFDLGQRAEVKRAAAAVHRKKADELERSAEAYDRQASGLKDYVLRVMAELPKPKRGVRTLEGTSATFKAKAVVDAVDITDEAEVPLEYKTVELKMPVLLWDQIWELGAVDHETGNLTISAEEEAQIRETYSVSRTLVKEALQKTETCSECEGSGVSSSALSGSNAGDPCFTCGGLKTVPARVPGARLLTDRLRLEVS